MLMLVNRWRCSLSVASTVSIMLKSWYDNFLSIRPTQITRIETTTVPETLRVLCYLMWNVVVLLCAPIVHPHTFPIYFSIGCRKWCRLRLVIRRHVTCKKQHRYLQPTRDRVKGTSKSKRKKNICHLSLADIALQCICATLSTVGKYFYVESLDTSRNGCLWPV